ncbi:Steryl acetyl hydrolase [Balamuthia mandrillaris]
MKRRGVSSVSVQLAARFSPLAGRPGGGALAALQNQQPSFALLSSARLFSSATPPSSSSSAADDPAKPTVLIAGSNVAALTLALCLKEHGIASEIVQHHTNPERFAAMGSFLPINAMRVMEKLGLREEIEAQGCRVDKLVHAMANGDTLGRIPYGDLSQRYNNIPNIGIRTSDLIQILNQALRKRTAKHPSLVTKSMVSKGAVSSMVTDEQTQKVTCRFTEGRPTKEYDVVVGADVLTAEEMLPSLRTWYTNKKNTVKHYNYAIWSAILPRPVELPDNYAVELLGTPGRIGMIPVSKKEVYVWAQALPTPLGINTRLLRSGTKDSIMFPKDQWPRFTAYGAPEVIKAFQSTSQKLWVDYPIDLVMPSFFTGNTALIANAAHKIAPFPQQDTALDIEDAWTLASSLASSSSSSSPIREALQEYSNKRVGRVKQVAAIAERDGEKSEVRDAGWTSLPAKLKRKVQLKMSHSDGALRRRTDRLVSGFSL